MRFLMLVSFLAAAMCSSEPTMNQVSAEVVGETLVIENGTDENVYFFAVGATIAPLILWAPSIGEENKVANDGARSVSLQDIMLDENEAEILFYWWNAIDANGELTNGNIQTMRVKI